MIMADSETPFAVMPYEMLNLDPAMDDLDATDDAVIDKFAELNAVIGVHSLVAIPAVTSGVNGVLVVQYGDDVEHDDNAQTVVEIFCEPFVDAHAEMVAAGKVAADAPDLLDRMGAAKLKGLFGEKV
jgi:hypothetical protein